MVTTDPASLPLRGNDLSVDFVNTVADVRTGSGEFLRRPVDLARWARHAGAIDAREFRLVQADLKERTQHAQEIHRKALELRAVLARIFTGRVAPRDLIVFDRVRMRAAQRRRVVSAPDRYALAWKDAPDLELIVARISDAALALMTSNRIGRVKQCDGPRCGWLFVDESRTRQRRWCSMADCGNRAKVRQFRLRTRK